MESRLERSKDMINYNIRIIPLLLTSVLLSACSSVGNYREFAQHNSPNSSNTINKTQQDAFLPSGKIVLSFPIDQSGNSNYLANNFLDEIHSNSLFPSDNSDMPFSQTNLTHENSVPSDHSNKLDKSNQLRFAPIIGFFPLTATFNPADNEVWLELDRESRQLKVYKGKKEIKTIKGEGIVALAPGEYPLQHKQKSPLWYAPDEYFENRELRVPPRGDNFRYRRGALGAYALYPTMDFIIHSGPFWSKEVGGMKVSESELSSIFLMINVGTPIVVK